MRHKYYKQQASEEDLEKNSTSLYLGLAALITSQQSKKGREKKKQRGGKKRQKSIGSA